MDINNGDIGGDMTLPQELIDNVIDHLHDSPRDLKRCSLVSHSFYPRSHFHLFQCVDVSSAEVAQRVFTHMSPETRAIIRSLTLSEPHWHNFPAQWPQIPVMLQYLHLDRLILKKIDLRILKTSLSGLRITSLETRSCMFDSLSELRSMPWSLPRLTTLIVLFPYFDVHSDRDNDSPSHKSALSTLTTTKCALLSPLFLTNLRDLRRLNIKLSSEEDVERLAGVIQVSRTSLRHLSLKMGEAEIGPISMMPESIVLRPLQTFTFKVPAGTSAKRTLAWGMALLEANASNLAGSIEIIAFRLGVYFLGIPAMSVVLAHIEIYKVLDTLADLFPLVKAVHIAFVFIVNDGTSLNSVPAEMLATLPAKDDMTDTIAKVLPKLAERKALVVDSCEFTTVENEAA